MPQVQHRISILMVALNEARHVPGVVSCLRNLRRPAGVTLETVLVDGGSRDGTAEAARAAGIDHVLVLPGASIPVCRNAAARAATGDWIAYIDADVEVAANWLETALPFLLETERALIAWPAAPPEPMTWLQAAWQFHWLHKNRRFEDWMGHRVIRHEGFRLATTRNMVLHRAVFDTVGGFDEVLTTGEDTDFAFRAYMAGIPVAGVPDLKAVHRGEPATLRQFFRQQLWHANRRSYAAIFKSTGGKVGGNAPKFAALFAATALLAVASLIAAIAFHPACLAGLLPLAALVGGPALLVSLHGRTLRHFPALCTIYFAYGLARALNLAGLDRTARNWKRATTGNR